MNKYDEVFYPTHSFPQTHPDRLATIATLLGMTPAPVQACRYLELGCGDANNLIPMAFYLPESRFVGVDLAGVPIAAGRKMAGELNLGNLQLHQMGIEEITEQFGPFDYIVAHGVYSWVPEEIRDKILEVCNKCLSENGVAYVSYNTFPGGHLRLMLREMMLFHVRDIEEPQQRIHQAQALLALLAGSKEENDVYIDLLKSEVAKTMKFDRSHLFHDDLADINEPVYFTQFIEHAAKHGLRFLGEADYFELHPNSFAPSVVSTLNQLGDDVIRREQYSDFIKCRRFRQTLLCREDIEVERSRQWERTKGLYAASSLRPTTAQPDLNSREVVEFRTENKSRISTDHPLLKNAFAFMGQRWPQAVHFNELLEVASSRESGYIPINSDEDAPKVLAEALVESYAADVVQLRSYEMASVTEVSERPCVNLLVRKQLETGWVITNELHLSIKLEDELGRALMKLMDGIRDRAALLRDLQLMADRGKLDGGKNKISHDGESKGSVGEQLEQNLRWLAKHALLVS
jgi:methyltransferase-like protein